MKKLLKKLVNWIKSLFGGKKETDKDLFPQLKWSCGGVDGSKAKDTGAKMRNLTVSRTRLVHEWESGGCEMLGSPSPSDAVCRACLFCHVNGEWVGGMFEWTGTTRTSRSLANIAGKYKGWDISLVERADKFAYVITNKSATLRTNVIVQNGAARKDQFDPNEPEFPPAEFPIDQLD